MSADPCLWNQIDTALGQALAADLATAPYGTLPVLLWPSDADDQGLYEDLRIATILTGETINPNQHPLPLILIRSYDAEYSGDGPHGDGQIHIDEIVYSYDLIALAAVAPEEGEATNATIARAKATATELLRRMRETIRARPCLGGLSSVDGETLIDVSLGGRPRIQVRGWSGTDAGALPTPGYLAGAVLPVRARSHI